MRNNHFKFFALSGVLGSALMFTGDMLLYYEPVSGADYDSVARMSEVSIERLIAGGAAGPLASILSAIGGYLFYVIFRPVNKILASILFTSFTIMVICGGTFHAMFPNYGFVGRLPESIQQVQIEYIRTYMESIYSIVFVMGSIWTLVLFYLVIFKKSGYPYWMLLFTPTLLVLLSGVIKDHVPYPFGAIIYGGWINLCFILFFLLWFIILFKIKSQNKSGPSSPEYSGSSE